MKEGKHLSIGQAEDEGDDVEKGGIWQRSAELSEGSEKVDGGCRGGRGGGVDLK